MVLMEDYLKYNNAAKIYDELDSPFVKQLRELNIQKSIPYAGEHLDEIAFNEYGDESLWWVIAIYNKILNPFNIQKDIIEIPDKMELITLITEYKQ